MTSSFARKSGRFAHPFRRFISGLMAFAMATVGLVGVQVAASQPASAAGNAPVGYVVNQTAGTVTVVNLQSNATVASINVGSTPYAAVLSPDGKKLYATSSSGNSLKVISTATNTVIGSITVGTAPRAVTVSRDGSTLYVSNITSGTLSVISTATNTVTNTVTVGATPYGVAVTPDGSTVYVANSSTAANSVSVVSTGSYTVTKTIPVGPTPYGLAMSPDGATLYVSNSNTSAPSISVIRTSDNTETSRITVDSTPRSMSLSPDGSKLYIACAGANALDVIEGGVLTHQITVGIGSTPRGVAITADGSTVFVTNALATSNTVSVVSTGSPPVVTSTFSSITNLYAVVFLSRPPTAVLAPVTGGAAGGTLSFDASGSTTPDGTIVSYQWTFGDGTTDVTTSPTTTHAYARGNPVGYAAWVTVVNNSGLRSASPAIRTPSVSGSPWIRLGYVANSTSNRVSVINLDTGVTVVSMAVGTDPRGIAISPDRSTVYVANYATAALGGGTVSVISAATNTVIKTITVGTNPTGVAASPDGAFVYVTNSGDGTVSVISTATNTVSGAAITVGTTPQGVVVSPEGSTIYVANYGSGSVSVIDASSHAVISVPVGSTTGAIAVSPDFGSFYVASSTGKSVSVFTTGSNALAATVPLGSGVNPTALAVSPDGSKVYVVAAASAASVISVPGHVVTTMELGNSNARGVVFSGDGSKAFVTTGDQVTPITAASNTPGTASASAGAWGIAAATDAPPVALGAVLGAVTPGTAGSAISFDASASTGQIVSYHWTFGDGAIATTATSTTTHTYASSYPPGYAASVTVTDTSATSAPAAQTAHVSGAPLAPLAYVSNLNAGTISVVDSATGVTLSSPTVGTSPGAVAVSPDGSKVCVVNSGSNSVSIITTASNAVATIAVQFSPAAIAISPDGGRVYVTNRSSNSVSVISAATARVVATIGVQDVPLGVAISPDGSKLYVTNSDSDSVSVITTVDNLLIASIPVLGPLAIAITPDGSKLYVVTPGSDTVSVISVVDGSVVASPAVGADPIGVAISPDGSTVYVTNESDGTVSVLATATDTVTATVAVSANPHAITVSPDGLTVYVTDDFAGTVTAISTSSHVTGTPVVGGPGYGIAFAPHQGPIAALAAVTGGAVYTAVSFNAAGSTATAGTIASYRWDFGDGTAPLVTTLATTSHTYVVDGSYSSTVTVTDSEGTSTAVVFTGQTASRNGTSLARAGRSVVIATAFGFRTAPSAFGFSGSSSDASGLSTTWPLAISNGAGAGWNITASATQWTSDDAAAHTLPLNALSVNTAPQVQCGTSGSCVPATSDGDYPYVIPAGTTAPTAGRLFSAAVGTGIGSQTVTPTLSLKVPSRAYSGHYLCSLTITLLSGP
jgi:YVTN family beta-propeller protein